MLKVARERAGLTQEELAYLLKCDRSTLSRYELKGYAPADVVYLWAKACKSPELINWYCKRICPIGKAYSYEMLDRIDNSMPAVIFAGIEEFEEGLVALQTFRKLMQNKSHKDDLSKDSQEQAEECLQQFIHDISRFTAIAKMTAAVMGFDIELGVKKNDRKVRQRGYTKENSSSYVVA